MGQLHGLPQRNAVFTGRDDELKAIHKALRSDGTAAVTGTAAIHGLGGEGKTQTAIEYAYRHQDEYEHIFMVRAEKDGEFESQMAALAPALSLTLSADATMEAQFQAVHNWFSTNGNWLLIVDNAENLSELRKKLPKHKDGRTLVTTRERVLPSFGTKVEISHLDHDTGALLLLRSAGIVRLDQLLDHASAENQAKAREVSELLGGLALAISQAGAYIAATEIPVKRYLELYAEEKQNLHEEPGDMDHDTVSVTYRMALKQVEAIPAYGPAAAQIIRLCAFLAPDAIPDEVFATYPDGLGEPLRSLAGDAKTWIKVAAAAAQFSLIKRESDPLGLSLHRLVAEVIRGSLSEEEHCAMLQAAVNAVSAAFPWAEYGNWDDCARFLPHALALAKPIEDANLDSPQAAVLLSKAAGYLFDRGRYREAEPLYRSTLAMRRHLHCDLHKDVATSLTNLGALLDEMGRLEEAAECSAEAVCIAEQLPDLPSEILAAHLNRLALVYYHQDRCADADPLSLRALELAEDALGPGNADVSICLNSRCLILEELGKFNEAELLRKRDLAISKKTLGKQHPSYATSLMNLGGMYLFWGKLDLAEGPLRESLKLRDEFYNREHDACAAPRFWLARWHYEHRELGHARDLFQQAREIRERFLGPDHPDTLHTRAWLERVTREIEEQDGK